MMRRLIALGILMMLALAGCKEEERLVDESVVDQQSTLAVIRISATIVPGCDTGDFEKWYEVVSSNARMFRDESFGFAAMGADAAAINLTRLSDIRDTIYQQPVPECMMTLHGQVLAFIDGISDSFYRYMNGIIQQDILLEEVTTAQAGYDTQIRVEIEAAAATLKERLQSNE